MTLQERDPQYCNTFLDANALDQKNCEQSAIVNRFHEITAKLEVAPIKSFGVQSEIQHPNTPGSVRQDMGGVYTLKTQLTSSEEEMKCQIRDLMTGNAKSDKHVADADHLFEAQKYGGGYFITHENRIHRKQKEIRRVLRCDLRIVTLSEFVEICEKFLGD